MYYVKALSVRGKFLVGDNSTKTSVPRLAKYGQCIAHDSRMTASEIQGQGSRSQGFDIVKPCLDNNSTMSDPRFAKFGLCQ